MNKYNQLIREATTEYDKFQKILIKHTLIMFLIKLLNIIISMKEILET